MNLSFRSFLACAGLALALPFACTAADSPVAPDALNFGLESNLDGWRAVEAVAMSSASAEAARSGKRGLRVEDKDATQGSSLFSPQTPVVAGTSYTLQLWTRTSVANGAGIWVRFYNSDRRVIGTAPTQIAMVAKSDEKWAPVKAKVQAPEGAAFLAFWIHSLSAAQGVFDFDDFSVTSEAITATTLPAPVARKAPAYIVIKADDLIAEGESVNPLWNKFVDHLQTRRIKSSIGIMANSLEDDRPNYIKWIKDRQATGLIEFWNHGYDHKRWTENGQTISEFRGVSYEQQKQHLQRANQLAREKLGQGFRTFGAPYNATDANTVKALADDADTKIWLYGDAAQPAAKLVLERVPEVNIEAQTFVPDALKFAEGYNRFPDREYFVIQGHPSHWTEERFNQFTRIIQFLVEANAVFVTPSEYAQLKTAP